MSEKKFWTVDELAELLRVSRRTIIRMLEDEEIYAIKVRRQWRIPSSEVEKLSKTSK